MESAVFVSIASVGLQIGLRVFEVQAGADSGWRAGSSRSLGFSWVCRLKVEAWGLQIEVRHVEL